MSLQIPSSTQVHKLQLGCHHRRHNRVVRLTFRSSWHFTSQCQCGRPAHVLASQRNLRKHVVQARRKKESAGQSFFTFDEDSGADEPPGPADDVRDISVTGQSVPAEVAALSLTSGQPGGNVEPGVEDAQDESEDGQFWEKFFMQAQQRQTQQQGPPQEQQVQTRGEGATLPVVAGKAPLGIGEQDVDFFIKPEHYLEVINSPFRYDTSLGEPYKPEPGEVDELPKDLESLSPEEVNEWAMVMEWENRYRIQWEEDDYLEQYFEISSRHAGLEVNRFAAVQRLATITRGIELQDEAGVTPETLQRIPPFVRANLVFDREFDWYNSQFDENMMSKRAQQEEHDEARVFGNIVVPEEMLAEHPLLGLEAKKAVEEAVDPLHRFLVGVLPGTEKDTDRVAKQQQYLTDLLGDVAEEG